MTSEGMLILELSLVLGILIFLLLIAINGRSDDDE